MAVTNFVKKVSDLSSDSDKGSGNHLGHQLSKSLFEILRQVTFFSLGI